MGPCEDCGNPKNKHPREAASFSGKHSLSLISLISYISYSYPFSFSLAHYSLSTLSLSLVPFLACLFCLSSSLTSLHSSFDSMPGPSVSASSDAQMYSLIQKMDAVMINVTEVKGQVTEVKGQVTEVKGQVGLVEDTMNSKFSEMSKRYRTATSPLSPTPAEAFTSLVDAGKVATEDFWLSGNECTPMVSAFQAASPQLGTGEDAVQSYLATHLELMTRDSGFRVQDTSTNPYLNATRKPDFSVFRNNAATTQMQVVAVIDAKKRRGNGSFTAAEKGHILSFGDVILQVQPLRPHVICALSDSVSVQFFKLSRCGENDRFISQTVVEGIRRGEDGFKHMCLLFGGSLAQLGYQYPSFSMTKRVEVAKYLGRGATSNVYLVKHDDDSESVVKVFRDGMQEFAEGEGRVLKALKGIAGVPVLEEASSDALLMSPVCSRLRGMRKTWFVSLVKTLRAVHDRRVVHRDIRPPNLLKDDKDVLLLTDWGFAADINSTTVYRGTHVTASDAVLVSVEAKHHHLSTAADDLLAAVRCSFCLLYPDAVAELWGLDDPAAIRQFWADNMPQGWKPFEVFAHDADYDKLCGLGDLFPVS
jgi:hypothetical protein